MQYYAKHVLSSSQIDLQSPLSLLRPVLACWEAPRLRPKHARPLAGNLSRARQVRTTEHAARRGRGIAEFHLRSVDERGVGA